MIANYRIVLKWSLVIALTAMLAGCGIMNKNQPPKKQVNLYVKTAAASQTYSNPNGLSGVSQTAAQDSTLQLTGVSMFVKQMMLKGKKIDSTASVQDSMSFNDDDMWDHYRMGAITFKRQKFVIDVPLNQDSVMVSATQVPSGKYYALFMHISRPDSADSAQFPDFVSGPSWKDRYSLIIKGTYNGQDFVYKSHRNFIIGMPIIPPVTITDSTSSVNVKLTVNTSEWFVNPWTGKTLDPTDSTNFRMIDWSIMRSFMARCGEHDYEYVGHHGWGHHNGH